MQLEKKVRRFLKSFLVVCSLICSTLSISAYGISNIESVRPGLPEEGLSGDLQFGIDGKTGNSREETYAASTNVIWRQQDNIFLGLASREYGSTSKITDTNNAFVHARWVHLISPKWAAEAFTQWEQDEFDNLESRSLVGGGGRYVITEKDAIYSLVTGLGAFREREKLDLDTFNEVTYLWRMNSYIAYKHVLNDNVSLISTAYYQPNLDRIDDFRMLLTLGVVVGLTDKLKLNLNYEVTHDSEPAKNLAAVPPIDNKKTNTEYATSLVYNF